MQDKEYNVSLLHSTVTGAVAGASMAFAVCMLKDISLADTLFRMFILAIGGAWIGFLLSWLNMILPKAKHPQEYGS